MTELILQTPDDWHLHFRDGDMLKETVAATARCFKRAIVMPNLVPPVTNAAEALAYKERILAARPAGSSFEPLMVLYLTDKTSAEDIKAAKAKGVVAAKLYPAGATTNSHSGVSSLSKLYPVLEVMAEQQMLLLVHGEVTDSHIDIFDREKVFIDQHLTQLIDTIPGLKVVFEHITTADAVEFVKAAPDRVAATITPQHLLLNRNDMLVGGVRPHNYCLPVLKRRTHQEALRAVVATGNKKFFLGTDSAPHAKHRKEAACGCAGCYSACGRSGQPALVVTYCATGNAHDQYYFRRSDQMVAGQVIAPRLDLANEALLRSHLHALWLVETGESLGSKLTQILDTEGDPPPLHIRDDKARALSDPDAVRRATSRALEVIEPLREELEQASWWHPDWASEVIAHAYTSFDRACDRWRDLYRAALADQAEQNKLVLSASLPALQRRQAEARRREAENQLRLLKNDDDERGHSDFYSYRYFASEGFLPGYSFPRLPLAAYIPGVRQGSDNRDGGDFLQRPRFLAISEFGPRALIYHEGARYEVSRVQVPMAQQGGVGTVDVQEARRCESCGYHHERQVGLDVCENCGIALGPPMQGMMKLQTVFTRRRERISSDEEERRRAGFELQTSYRFADHGARSGRLDAEIRDAADQALGNLAYGDTATVRVTNLGLRRRQDPTDHGYWLDTVTGRWLTDRAAADATSSSDDDGMDDATQVPTKQRVVPFVEDTRNILVLRLAERVSPQLEASLRAALERGIEAAFQLEDSELAAERLPDDHEQGRMLFSEAAEGGAGVLRRLHAEPDALATAARKALEIAHFDPDTGDDLGHAPTARERCEKACYDCLLSYSNQWDHELVDRHLVRDLLRQLAASHVVTAAPGVSRDAAMQKLLGQCDTEDERRFLELLQAGDHALPTGAQELIEGARSRPDFVYRTDTPTAIFIDGTVHDRADVSERDAAAVERLIDAGWSVLRLRYDQDWEDIIRKRSDVFGAGRSTL